MIQIMVIERKHGSTYIQIQAPDPELLATNPRRAQLLAQVPALLAYLHESDAQGYFYEPSVPKHTDEEAAAYQLPAAEYEALPSVARLALKPLREKVARRVAEYDRDLKVYGEVREVLDAPFADAVRDHAQTIVNIAMDRNGGEYEGYEIESVETPEEVAERSKDEKQRMLEWRARLPKTLKPSRGA